MKRNDSVQQCKLTPILRLAPKVCLLAGILMSGCASQPDLSVEEQVGARALQWADALMAQDYDKALTYMTPSYQNGPRAQRFMASYAGASSWLDAKVLWVRCDDENGVPPPLDALSLSSSDAAAENIADPGNTDDCYRNTWYVCDDKPPAAPLASTAISGEGTRCVVRMLKTAQMPQMSFAMPLASNYTWLNLEAVWYLYAD
jgi:hypothetical protein